MSTLTILKILLTQFNRAELDAARDELRSFLHFQVTADECARMIRYFLTSRDTSVNAGAEA